MIIEDFERDVKSFWVWGLVRWVCSGFSGRNEIIVEVLEGGKGGRVLLRDEEDINLGE